MKSAIYKSGNRDVTVFFLKWKNPYKWKWHLHCSYGMELNKKWGETIFFGVQTHTQLIDYFTQEDDSHRVIVFGFVENSM